MEARIHTLDSAYGRVLADLREHPRTWLITGVAGFIGSNLLEALLQLGQRVVGVDNFATGHRRNLEEVSSLVDAAQWGRFTFLEGDIVDANVCRHACEGVDVVLHQAALGSVPRSIENPRATNASNITGFLEMLVAARDARVRRFVYAASSSTYGDHAALPKIEERIGRPLSPYAVSKYVNELYAEVFGRCYGFETIGLRYFNVFGPRQDPNGPYAAVIPRWIAAMVRGSDVCVNGDGEQSRDFCYIENVIQANLLAATSAGPDAVNQVYNVAVGDRTTLNQLLEALRAALAEQSVEYQGAPVYGPARAGDVRHSQADVSKAGRLLGYQPAFRMDAGIRKAMPWYVQNLRSGSLATAAQA